MARDEHHIVPNSNGGWDVKSNGAEKACRHFDRKRDAVDSGRVTSRNQGTEFIIHGKDDRIQRSDSHGGDSNPPRDRDTH